MKPIAISDNEDEEEASAQPANDFHYELNALETRNTELLIENGSLKSKISKMTADVSNLEKELAQLKPDSALLRSKNTRRSQADNEPSAIDTLTSFVSSPAAELMMKHHADDVDNDSDQEKIHRLNSQIFSMRNRAAQDKMHYEAEISRLQQMVAQQMVAQQSQPITISSATSSQTAIEAGKTDAELKGKYEELMLAAKEVAKYAGHMANETAFGQLGSALIKLNGAVLKEEEK